MKTKHLIALLQSGYTTIQVQFDNGKDQRAQDPVRAVPWSTEDERNRGQQPSRHPGLKTYTYKARGKVLAGQRVVVEVGDVLHIATVVAVDPQPRIDTSAEFTYKWIVQVIDRTSYDKTNEEELQFQDTLQAVEREQQREILMKEFTDRLPAGTTARVMFDNAIAALSGAPAALVAPVTASDAPTQDNIGMACK